MRRRWSAHALVSRLSPASRLAYGIYVIVVTLACFTWVGLLMMVVPGQMRRRRIARFGTRAVFFLAGIPLKVDGRSYLPDTPCVVVANHRSYLDGPALIAALPARFTPIIKAEIAAIPILSTVLRRAGARFVRRAPVIKAGRDTAAMLDGLKQGESLALFPEGRVSVDDGLLPFREGAFFLASKTGCPVVPVTIEGTQAVLPLGHLVPRLGTIHVEAAAPLAPSGEKRPESRALRGRTETALWHDLRPATASTRRALAGYRYYLRVFRGCTPPFAYLDLDEFRLRIRRVLEQSRGKRLRVDVRVLASPAIVDRILRSDIRFNGGLCASLPQAVGLADVWRLPDMIVAEPVGDDAGLDYACDAIARGVKISLSVSAAAEVEAAARAAQRHRIDLPLCILLGTSSAGGGASSAALADLLSLVDLVEHRARLVFRGVLEQHRDSADTEIAGRAPEQKRAAIRAQLAARGYENVLYSVCDNADLVGDAQHAAVTEIVVGREFFVLDKLDGPAWPVAGYVLETPEDECLRPNTGPEGYRRALAAPSCSAPTGPARRADETANRPASADRFFFAAPDTAALDARFMHLYLVQGGAVVKRIDTTKAVGPAGVRPPNRRRRHRAQRRGAR